MHYTGMSFFFMYRYTDARNQNDKFSSFFSSFKDLDVSISSNFLTPLSPWAHPRGSNSIPKRQVFFPMVCFPENSKMSLFLSVSQHFSPHDFNSHSFAYYKSFKPKEWQPPNFSSQITPEPYIKVKRIKEMIID